MDANNEQTTITARLEIVLYVVAFGSFAFGVGDCVAGPLSFAYGNYIAISFSSVWAGFAFAIVNGSLALRAVCNKPSVNYHWAKVCFGFGIATLVMHCGDLGVAIASLVGYGYKIYYHDGFYYYRVYNLTIALPEVARLVMLTCLVVLDSLEIAFTKKFMDFPLNKHPNAVGFQALQYAQTFQQVQMAPNATAIQMPTQTGMTFTNQAGQVFVMSPVAPNNIGFSAAVLPGSAAPTAVNAGASTSSAAPQGQNPQQTPPQYQDKF